MKRVVSLDVAPHFTPTLKTLASILSYQSWLASAFKLGGPIGDWMTRRMAAIARAPAPPERLHANQNYPYRNMLADIASGRRQRLTKGYWQKCPLLII